MATQSQYVVTGGLAILIRDVGVSPAAVLRRAQLPRDLFVQGPASVSADQYFRIWTALEEEFGDAEMLPVKIGQAISTEVFDPPIFAALCSQDLNHAARRIAHFKPLISPIRLAVERSPHETTVTYLWPAHECPPPGLVAAELVFWVALARLATRASVHPRRVTAPDPPAAPKAYLEYLGQPIGRGSHQMIAFAARDAERLFVTANEQMWEFFEPELRRRLSDLEGRSSLTERVRCALLELLPAGVFSLGAVAAELAVSPRTLQRRLRAEGTTFQATLDATRESLARHYLTQSSVSAGEISVLLGYEDSNSFYRAFQSWTGQTPASARAAAA